MASTISKRTWLVDSIRQTKVASTKRYTHRREETMTKNDDEEPKKDENHWKEKRYIYETDYFFLSLMRSLYNGRVMDQLSLCC